MPGSARSLPGFKLLICLIVVQPVYQRSLLFIGISNDVEKCHWPRKGWKLTNLRVISLSCPNLRVIKSNVLRYTHHPTRGTLSTNEGGNEMRKTLFALLAAACVLTSLLSAS